MFDLRQTFIWFEQICIWFKDILFESNKFCFIETKHFFTSKKMFQTNNFFDSIKYIEIIINLTQNIKNRVKEPVTEPVLVVESLVLLLQINSKLHCKYIKYSNVKVCLHLCCVDTKKFYTRKKILSLLLNIFNYFVTCLYSCL